jgi:uncharacterized protein YgiB involved in biofilm formation
MPSPTATNISNRNADEQLQAAIEQAREACSTHGSASVECATNWDIVEEMQADQSHRRQTPQKTSLQQYCDEHPEASECLIYDV